MKISLLVILFVAAISCSDFQKRTPSSPRATFVNNISKEFRSVHEQNIQNAIQNTFKIILDATYKSETQKINQLRIAKAYLYDSTKKIIHNDALDKLGQTEGFKSVYNPPRWTLLDEVEWIEDQIVKNNPAALNYDVGSYIKALKGVSVPILEIAQESNVDIHKDIKELYTVLSESEDETKVALAYFKKFEKGLDPYFKRFRNIGTEIAASGEVDFGNPEAEKFFVKFLDYYYSNVDISVIKNIINDLADLGNPNPDKMEVVKVMFKNSGPGLGKTLQQLGKDPQMGHALAEIIEILEDEGKAVPLYLVERAVSADKGGFKISNLSEMPLGTGTMAQVNKATLTEGKKSKVVAVRFLKPGIEGRVADDLSILKSFVEQMAADGEFSEDFLPSARKLVESISKFLKSELDIPDAIKKQDFAQKVYQGKNLIRYRGDEYTVNVKVPDVYYPKGKKKSKLHIQEFITFGEKFSNIKDKNSQRNIALGIMEVWFREALIKSGFVHSDLHQGNFTVKNITNNSAEVVLFDFGMSEVLTKKTRQSFILIGAGVENKSSALIADGILLMDDSSNKAKRKKMIKLIDAEISNIEKVEEWIVWALKQGYLKNDQLGTLARGGVLVSQLGKIIGEEDIHEEVVEKLLTKNALKAFSGNKDFPLTRGQVIKLGASTCFNSIKSFFRRSKK